MFKQWIFLILLGVFALWVFIGNTLQTPEEQSASKIQDDYVRAKRIHDAQSFWNLITK